MRGASYLVIAIVMLVCSRADAQLQLADRTVSPSHVKLQWNNTSTIRTRIGRRNVFHGPVTITNIQIIDNRRIRIGRPAGHGLFSGRSHYAPCGQYYMR